MWDIFVYKRSKLLERTTFDVLYSQPADDSNFRFKENAMNNQTKEPETKT